MIVGKFKVSKFSMDYDEYVSNGTFGLIKAVLTFENDRNISFSTYATKCITNEIILLDVLTDPKANFADRFEKNETLEEAINIVLNWLNGQQRLIILYRTGGIRQADISNMLEHNYCQSTVSRIEKKALRKIRNIYNNNISYKKIITMEIENKDVYKFSFSKKYIINSENIIKILEKQEKNLLGAFKISNNKDWIEIRTLACEKSFL